MRRKNRQMQDEQRLHALLAEISHGCLAFVGADGWPAQRALNFVFTGGCVYFHGSRKGEKMEALVRDDRATFLAVKDFAIIPSHFVDPKRACPATQFYESVSIRGRVRSVEDGEEKAAALQALMEKLQPEGGHVPITAEDPLYTGSIAGTAVLRLDIEDMVGKASLGQDKPESRRQAIQAGLADRGAALDGATIEAMARCPLQHVAE